MPETLDGFLLKLRAGDKSTLWTVRILVRTKLPIPLDAPGPIVFIPDLHLLSQDQAVAYEEYFHLAPGRETILMDFLRHLLLLKNGDQDYRDLKVFQLGDFHDLWREARHWWGENVRDMLQRQLEDHRCLIRLFGELEAERVIGNHESVLRNPKIAGQNSDVWPAERLKPHYLPLLIDASDLHYLLILHGDQVDSNEQGWRRIINPPGSRLVKIGWIAQRHIDEWAHEVAGPGSRDTEIDAPALFDPISYQAPSVVDTYPKPRKKAQETNQLYYAEIERDVFGASDVMLECGGRRPVAAFIGHTHYPRIVFRNTFCYQLVDSGSWVNRGIIGTKTNPEARMDNAQIGVLAQDQVAIIQIG